MFDEVERFESLCRSDAGVLHQYLSDNAEEAWDIPNDGVLNSSIRATCRIYGEEVAIFSGVTEEGTFFSPSGYVRRISPSYLRGKGIFSQLHDRLAEVLRDGGISEMVIETQKHSTAEFFLYKGAQIKEVDGDESSTSNDFDMLSNSQGLGDDLRHRLTLVLVL